MPNTAAQRRFDARNGGRAMRRRNVCQRMWDSPNSGRRTCDRCTERNARMVSSRWSDTEFKVETEPMDDDEEDE